MSEIKVVIADDHPVVRSGLRRLLDGEDGIRVVGEAADAAEAERLALERMADVVVLDLMMPGGGMQALRAIRARRPECRVVVLTMTHDATDVRTAVALGAAGYVSKQASNREIVMAVRAVAQSSSFVSLGPDESLAWFEALDPGQPQRGTACGDGLARLSRRERDVLELLAQGYSCREAGERLHLSAKTVETYRARLGDKLGLKNRVDIVRFALEIGLLKAGGP